MGGPRIEALKKWLIWGIVASAMLGIPLTMIASEAARHPAIDATYQGFDLGLASAQYGIPSASISGVSNQAIDLAAAPGGSFNLITTPLARFSTSLNVRVGRIANTTDSPTLVGLWSPWTSAGYFIAFSGRDHGITTQMVLDGVAGNILTSGQTVRRRALGIYRPDVLYRVEIEVDKNRFVRLAISGAGLSAEDSLTAAQASPLFKSVRLSITAAAGSAVRSGEVVLTAYELQLPHEVFFANKVDDRLQQRILVGFLVVGGTLIALWMLLTIASRRRWPPTLRLDAFALADFRRSWLAITVGLSIVIFLGGNWLLFGLGAHPFDMSVEQVYAYVGGAYGPASLYYLPNTVSPAWIWAGIPYNEAGFPYEPVFAYLSVAIGWIGHLLGNVDAASTPLEYLIKLVNVLFGLGDALLIFLISRMLNVGRRWSLAAAALFLFNPAVWFSMSVWGQTHVISVFFALLAIWAGQKNRPFLAWLSLGAACLTRPQMLVFGIVIGAYLVRRFTFRQTAVSLSMAAIATFIAIAPLTLSTSASLPVDVLANDFRIQEAGGNDRSLTTVSQDAYSVWPLVTYLKQGSSGILRSFSPSSQSLWGTLTYQRAGLIATLILLTAVAVLMLGRRRPEIEVGTYLPLVALGIVGFLMLMTGLVATHFILALPFLILCRRWMGTGSYLFIVIVWTVTTLVPMYGDMGNVIRYLNYPLLSPDHNPVTKFFVALYSWDRFITFGTLANLCVMVWIGIVALRRNPRPSLVPFSG